MRLQIGNYQKNPFERNEAKRYGHTSDWTQGLIRFFSKFGFFGISGFRPKDRDSTIFYWKVNLKWDSLLDFVLKFSLS